RYRQMIHESADDALGYIRHYLESRGDGPSTASGEARACLRQTLEWLQQPYEIQLDARGIHLQLSLPAADAAFVAIDGRVPRQLGENLVTNAIQYTPGAALLLAGRPGAPGYLQLVAADPGHGISSGLGLSLAKRIVTNAGGQLWYEDRPGGGAVFVIELPEVAAEA